MSLLPNQRRHDLDALRAFAMLLGIVLHGCMSFVPGLGWFWGVQDSRSSSFYAILLASIHGWRMPLFFLISGYFTAMLYRKRGLGKLLIHRFKRIFLPMLLAMATVIPAIWFVSESVRGQQTRSPGNEGLVSDESKSNTTDEIDIWAAAATNDLETLHAFIESRGDLEARDPYGSTPLHVACLFGRGDAGKLLLDAGANLDALNHEGQSPKDLLQLNWETTSYVARMVGMPVDKDAVFRGREEIASAIETQTGKVVSTESQQQNITEQIIAGLIGLLFYVPVFHHLWFLWFLCWFVLGFGVIVKLKQTLSIPSLSSRWLTTSRRYFWLIPLTAVPQYWMARTPGAFGPDTSIGLLPLPNVLAYYAIFFGFGAIYFAADDPKNEIGKRWPLLIGVAVLVLLPIGMQFQVPGSGRERVLFSGVQVAYAWLMSFGMIGLFHRLFNSNRFWVRYLSDSSYWLYLVHIPLVLYLQFIVKDWAVISGIKFVIVCATTTLILLVSYQILVRSTWIGWLLNGRMYPWQLIPAKK